MGEVKASLRAATSCSLSEAVGLATLTVSLAGPKRALFRIMLGVSSVLDFPPPRGQNMSKLESRVKQMIHAKTWAEVGDGRL